MKFKPWQETLSSSRSLFKVLPSSLSPPGPKGYCWVGVAQWRCSIRVALLFRQCSSCTRQQLQAGVAKAPGSCPTLLQREAQPPQQLIHTKKRAWPFLFNLRIFPRRCLAVAIPFFGRLPFVAWLLTGGGFEAGLLVGWRGTEKEGSPAGRSGLTLPLFIWHMPAATPEFCAQFPLRRPVPLLSIQFLLCTFWLASDEPSFLMHFWFLFRSWGLNLEVLSICLIQEEVLKSCSSVFTWYPHSTGLS